MSIFREEVVKWWELTGCFPWDFEITKKVCFEINDYFEKIGQDPAPKLRVEINQSNYTYIRRWIMGCHFEWLNPHKTETLKHYSIQPLQINEKV